MEAMQSLPLPEHCIISRCVYVAVVEPALRGQVVSAAEQLTVAPGAHG